MEWVFQYLSDSMTALMAAAGCAAIALAAILICVADLLRNRYGEKSGALECAWSKDNNQLHGGAPRWACGRCGVYAFGKGNNPPVSCRRYEPKLGI
ncbi:MAG: hypothetical protein WCJ41_09850 [Aestuariivirga sp.]|uniref:hypothetical protein n=1 Tax=Aestuariivirga sp. TaxID=2650926 RepID=UPI003019FC8E